MYIRSTIFTGIYTETLKFWCSAVGDGTVNPPLASVCALTGNVDTGIDCLAGMPGFEARRSPLATMEFATSAAVLAGVGTFVRHDGTEVKVGSGDVGPVTQQLRAALVAIQNGAAPATHGWTRKV